MAKRKVSSDSFEQILFKSADKLRKNMDAAEYKHIVLGLIFLKYISDSFEEHRHPDPPARHPPSPVDVRQTPRLLTKAALVDQGVPPARELLLPGHSVVRSTTWSTPSTT